MASSTKEALGNALKKMLGVKSIDKITVKDLVEECCEWRISTRSAALTHLQPA